MLFYVLKKSIDNVIDKKKSSNKYGWGVAVHITPSNVPINFAFSTIFGLLSGNHNFVSLPSKNSPQAELLVSIFGKIANLNKYESIIKNNFYFKSERDNPVLEKFVNQC